MNNSHLLLVADRCYWPLLLQSKKNHPETNVKLLDKEELLDALSFSWKPGLVPALMRHGLDFISARKWAKILRVADATRNEKAQIIAGWAKEFERGPAIPPKTWLKNRTLCLFEMDEDQEIRLFLDRKGIPYTLCYLSDFGFLPKFESGHSMELLSFRNKFQQYFYLFGQLRKRLIEAPEAERGDLIRRIRIHVQDESDSFYLQMASEAFQIPVVFSSSRPLLSFASVSKKLKEIHQSGDYSFTEEECQDESLSQLKKLVDDYGIASLPQEKERYANLLEIVSSLSYSLPIGDRGIQATSSFHLEENSLVYITDFAYGSFYREFDDKNVLPDAELEAIGANPSYALTSLDKRKKKNYLAYSNLALVSRVREHLSDAIYDSQFLEGSDPFSFLQKREETLGDGLFTQEAKKLWDAHEWDRQFVSTPQEDGYRSYDPSFQTLGPLSGEDLPKRWSISRIESYRKCPYRYYLKQYLNEGDQDYHFAYLGVLVHKVMEKAYDADFDYEASFQEGVQSYQEAMEKNQEEWTPRDGVLIAVYHDALKIILDRVLTWKEHASIVQSIPEETIRWNLEDEQGSYEFTGRVDKIVHLERGDARYYYVIDYKTGSETFDPRYPCIGESVQLPLYYEALSTLPENRKKALCGTGLFGGFGLQQIYFPSMKAVFDDHSHALEETRVLTSTAFRGIHRNEEDFWYCADEDETSFKTDSKGNTKCTFSGNYIAKPYRFASDTLRLEESIYGDKAYSITKMVEDAKKASLSIIHAIESGEFPISPTSQSVEKRPKTEKELVCSSCGFRDICYRKANDFQSVFPSWKIIRNHFEQDKRKEEAEAKKRREEESEPCR